MITLFLPPAARVLPPPQPPAGSAPSAVEAVGETVGAVGAVGAVGSAAGDAAVEGLRKAAVPEGEGGGGGGGANADAEEWSRLCRVLPVICSPHIGLSINI